MRILDRELTPADFEVLEFERATWPARHQGTRERLVLQRFGTSMTRHTQKVLALIEHPAAAAYDPVLVRRLRDRVSRAAALRATGRRIEVS